MPDKPARPADLPTLAKNFTIQTRDSAEEIKARIQREQDEANHQRYKDKVILWAVIIVVGGASLASLACLFLPGTSPETLKWATTLLTTVVAGGLGYMTGKGSK
jgi:hypothetical protein